jgi:hypothetical protein
LSVAGGHPIVSPVNGAGSQPIALPTDDRIARINQKIERDVAPAGFSKA